MYSLRIAIGWMLVLVTLPQLAGCGGGSQDAPNDAAENIRQVAVLCGTYARAHKGKFPPSLDELKKFAKNTKDAAYAPASDSIFVSPRDSQPYAIAALQKMPTPAADKKTIIVYEQSGVNGRRYVAYELGQVEEIDEVKFQQLALPKK